MGVSRESGNPFSFLFLFPCHSREGGNPFFSFRITFLLAFFVFFCGKLFCFLCHSRESGNPFFFFFVILNSLLIRHSGFVIRHFPSNHGTRLFFVQAIVF